jgi:tRNA A-37 threonylcarbamoyl transferase component Bud32
MKDSKKYVYSLWNGVSWLIAEGYQEEPLFASPFDWSQGSLLRATRHRRVVRVEGKHRALLVKHFVHSWVGVGLKALLRGSPANREWIALCESRHRGLPVPTPVALGEAGRIWKRESWLVTEFIDGSVPLHRCLLGPDRLVGSYRSRAVREVARLIRRAHDAGFYQPDLHAANILLRSGQKELDLFLIDLQRVSFSSSLSLRRRWQNLSVLNGGCTEASLVDRVRFLRSYLSTPPALTAEFRKLAFRLEREGQRHRLRLWRSRQKRCLAENRDFLKIRTGDFLGFARRKSWSAGFQSRFAGFHGYLADPSIQLVKDSLTTTIEILSLDGVTFYVKRYNYQGLGYGLKGLFRSSRARRAWFAANSMRLRGVPGSLPVAYLERRRFRILLESYLITRAVNGKRISEMLDKSVVSNAYLRTKRSLIQDLACWLGKMHLSGVSHRDLKDTNIVVQKREPGKYNFFIVDFDGVRFGYVSWRRRIKNISRLTRAFQHYPAVTQTDRLRFLKAYLGIRERNRWKKIWRQAEKRILKPASVWLRKSG